MTSAKLGSQCPAISRNASTFTGLTICDMTKPKPNKMPQNKVDKFLIIALILSAEPVAHDINSNACNRHEHDGSRSRTR